MEKEIHHLVHRNTIEEILTAPSTAVIVYGIQPKDRKILKCFSYYIIIQCIVIFAGIATVLQCVWKPDDGIFELDILSRIMYLYDTNACGVTRSHKHFQDLFLDNNTHGLHIIPIRHEPVFLQILTKLSGNTRTHMEFSLAFHIIWLIAALLLLLFSNIENMKILKIILQVFRYACIVNVCYDVSMAIVYVAHIQQSLTKAMIIRYSGWGMMPRSIQHPQEFGGWVPLIAAGLWLRGGIFFILNMYIIRFIRIVMQKIRGKEVKSRISAFCNVPFPDAHAVPKLDRSSLYFKAGEYKKF